MRKFLIHSSKYIYLLVVCLMILCSCSSKDNDKEINSIKTTANYKLIYEETISPNKNYVTADEDILKYKIQIFSNKDKNVIVEASSNSAFFKEMQYTIDYDKPITKDDISIKWTTLMGNPEATEEDQFAIANVSITSNEKVLQERKINFVKGVIEIITETIN